MDFHGVLLEPHEDVRNYEERIHFHGALKPHWEEFADALNTFDLTLGILDEDVESTFKISQIQLSVIPLMLIAGFITPLPYNYWRLKALGKGCH